MLPTARKLSFSEVPVVDLAPAWRDAAGRQEVAQAIADAAGTVGFFYIKNHGLSDEDIRAIFQTAVDFHSLPLEDKMAVSVKLNNHAQGYLYGMSKGNDKNISENLQEAFQIRRPLAADDPGLLAGKPLHGLIPWPPAMPDLEPRMMAYYEKVNELGYWLLGMFEQSLGLAADTLKASFAKDMNSLRLLHYPPQRPDESGEHLGARNHTDTNAFTILAQDVNGGLEVRNREGEWVAVPPMAGTLVVNVGEVLKVWTDGVFTSAVHRVINRSGNERYSIPFFMYPSYDALIQPLIQNPDPANIAPEDLPTSFPRRPFVYGELKSRNVARIMPQKETA
ncbi:2-oxoglutarate-dependent ethylene/succinate-forming enzyme [Pigmentiphaga humi]|uniref:2-oxoglutarate-dependent ethylene/succinate-forming enzyme n=1 Tax=Pigmentiphaga humi TaxID=2478468 RepID=A0A3P4B0H1_9BURK|nr:2OG-Fe(II) oxygenase family protein [Pigmentiphaga humi]VCU69789.1 2-oxoglutarate-dependent ethylene/succinate-forming enzyme [Pigmentiphaga humi]